MPKSRKAIQVTRPAVDIMATCFHEAGHAVVALSLDLPVDDIKIFVEDVAEPGVCRLPNVLNNLEELGVREQRRLARKVIVQLYAGLPAERLFDSQAPIGHANADINEAWQISRQYHVFPRYFEQVDDDRHKAYMETLRVEAGRHVRKHSSEITHLAKLLKSRLTMSGPEIEQVLAEFKIYI